MTEEETFSFNFWPSFADLMLSVVLILILVIFVIYSVLSVGSINLRHVEERQQTMIEEFAKLYGVAPQKLKTDEYAISISGKDTRDISIHNDPTLQRFSFGSHILFAQDDIILSANGRRVLMTLGKALKAQLPRIKEIQIQGHADPVPSRRFNSNLDLAAFRAMEVYRFFQNEIGVDPAKYLMSATSFGEYKPVQRTDTSDSYSRQKFQADNMRAAQRDRNRRIELLLFYRF